MTNSHKLKIGLDYHGVIDLNPKYFAEFCTKAKQRNHDIYIITGGPKTLVDYNLKKNHVLYDMCFAVSDYYQAKNKIIQKTTGEFIVPDNLWNMAKADFCRRSHINIHIDDSLKYINWFSTPYCYYDKNTNKGYISPGLEINFNNSAEDVLHKIESITANLTCFL